MITFRKGYYTSCYTSYSSFLTKKKVLNPLVEQFYCSCPKSEVKSELPITGVFGRQWLHFSKGLIELNILYTYFTKKKKKKG